VREVSKSRIFSSSKDATERRIKDLTKLPSNFVLVIGSRVWRNGRPKTKYNPASTLSEGCES
jgi:hypothetical protein